ncbi:hypothetical protein DL93DRAFT_2089267 [Clavulina sp. PMI_390]|nr:hypothetical protein DL93DRAFT_2089267 [Clavulina sp. PMI_390]
MEVLRHRPWLLIHNAELYQCIHSNELWEQAWATTSDAESPNENEPSSPSSAKRLTMPERIPLLESRIKNIPRDVRKPRPPGRIRSIAEKLSEEYVHLSNS